MSALAVGRFRLAPALTAVVLTVLLLWLFGTAAEIFLLLFISVLISLYLSAGADVIQRNSGMPRLGAFWITVALSLLAVVALFWTLVPPVVEQTQSSRPSPARPRAPPASTLAAIFCLKNSRAFSAFHRVAVEKITAIKPLGIHWLAV
jgi:hypothetical protein